MFLVSVSTYIRGKDAMMDCSIIPQMNLFTYLEQDTPDARRK